MWIKADPPSFSIAGTASSADLSVPNGLVSTSSAMRGAAAAADDDDEDDDAAAAAAAGCAPDEAARWLLGALPSLKVDPKTPDDAAAARTARCCLTSW